MLMKNQTTHSKTPSPWQGRVDEDGSLRWHQVVDCLDPELQAITDLTDEDLAETIALLGYACDEGITRNQGRSGAAEGPRAIRAALSNLPKPIAKVIDLGNVDLRTNKLTMEQAQARLADGVCHCLNKRAFPVVLGGGHDVAFGSFSGLARHIQSKGEAMPSIGIINFDAHFDLRRDPQPSSGTPFEQIAETCADNIWPFQYLCLGISEFANTPILFDTARARNVRWLSDEQMAPSRLDLAMNTVSEFVRDKDYLYLSFCLDVLPAHIAPGVSAPAARGVELAVIEPLLDAVLQSGKVVLADIAEMNPRFDIDSRTARLAARLVARMVGRHHQ